jgi:hypothetical protein
LLQLRLCNDLLRWEAIGEVGLLSVAIDLSSRDTAPPTTTRADADHRALWQPSEDLGVDIRQLAYVELAGSVGNYGKLRDIRALIERLLLEIAA